MSSFACSADRISPTAFLSSKASAAMLLEPMISAWVIRSWLMRARNAAWSYARKPTEANQQRERARHRCDHHQLARDRQIAKIHRAVPTPGYAPFDIRLRSPALTAMRLSERRAQD